MIAILIAEENREKIASSGCFFDRLEQLDVAMEFTDKVRYFVPDTVSYKSKTDTYKSNYLTYPEDLFEKIYDFDHEKIKTDFTGIVRKK